MRIKLQIKNQVPKRIKNHKIKRLATQRISPPLCPRCPSSPSSVCSSCEKSSKKWAVTSQTRSTESRMWSSRQSWLQSSQSCSKSGAAKTKTRVSRSTDLTSSLTPSSSPGSWKWMWALPSAARVPTTRSWRQNCSVTASIWLASAWSIVKWLSKRRPSRQSSDSWDSSPRNPIKPTYRISKPRSALTYKQMQWHPRQVSRTSQSQLSQRQDN